MTSPQLSRHLSHHFFSVWCEMAKRSLSFLGEQRSPSSERLEDLSHIVDQINAANERLNAVRHHTRLFADMALTVSDASTSISVDAAAVGWMMTYFTAQLEETIESLEMAHAQALGLGEQTSEPTR
jgi:hypothetical protein